MVYLLFNGKRLIRVYGLIHDLGLQELLNNKHYLVTKINKRFSDKIK